MKRSASRRVVITGMGVVSPLGCTVDLFWHLLSRGESAVKPITSFDTSPFQACLAAEVQDFDPEDFLHRKQARRMGRATQFAVASAMMAARDSGIDLEHEDRAAIGISIGTSIGGLKEAFDFHDAARQTAYGRVNPFTMGMTFPNAISSEVAIVLGLHGPCETYSIGCSSTANAIGRAYEWIKSGQSAIVVAGGTEAPLHQSIYAAMDAGRALAPDGRGTIRNLPRPFDKTRCGMVLGEGAGCFILEEYEHARARGAKMYAELEGWGFTCDAHSMIKPAADGHEQRRAAALALSTAHWFPEEVDYVNACGLGTMELDALETETLKQVLGDHAYRVPVSSFKAALGHAFAASGAFQVIGTAKAMEHQFIPPTLNLTTPDPTCDLDYVSGRGRSVHLDRALINSFGFGGKNIVLALSRVDVGVAGTAPMAATQSHHMSHLVGVS
ncbi:MAG: 3-oxoacyl-[acyl-carrier-protein] synthase 2 [Nitrospirae bacterium]|mgnify:CR=1 FL=1|nr:3-oxoacyl-[acyl-carrier-protein] synthase 2 [Nitrospirota bacterium]MCE7967062.1 beta-ketoacyl-[acyl-carrier-protein] synthase family protein [Nitrospira sp. NTP2]MCK6492841.1 beta-ketoacyl-[acyl-carrier-protein] synthase family protein [Nitrospira sp.]MEB2337887.1 beta-ketoacyl-[acyl-carrier-protein] synthase family protein [Nitrospirales bacterium]QOJ34973.1 MAG: beta-ketoacyl-[acyl-carrier-protein] synthase family protein [Nitrospira sp.]